MNITITQDNSRIETLGSNGASIILKLYDLSIDSNNTLTLRGNISTAYAYGDLVDYLNTTYGPDLIVNATNRYITFTDSAVQSILLAAGFGDGTGITGDLAAVAELGETFKYNTNITSFPEFKYFTRVNTNLSAWTLYFRGCTNLTSIDLSMCEVLTDYEFADSGLAIDVNAPRLVKAGTQALGGCNITKISNLGSITSIPSCFCIECSNLTEVTLPSTITSICSTGYGAFRNCVNLTTVRGLENVTTIGNLAFYNCRSLTPIDLSNVISIGNEAFKGTTISGNVILNNLTSIGEDVFGSAPITMLDLSLSTITSLKTKICDNNSALTTVKLPDTLTTFGISNNSSPFRECKNITKLIGGKGITAINNSLDPGVNISNPITLLNVEVSPISIIVAGQHYSSSFSLMYLPKFKYTTSESYLEGLYSTTVTHTFFSYLARVGDKYLNGNLIYFKNLEKIKVFMFWQTNFQNLVINNITPPTLDTDITTNSALPTYSFYSTWMNNMFGDIPTATMTIYVPDSAISTYQADSNYNAYTIKGISELTLYPTEADWIAAGSPANGLITEYM